MEKHIPLLTVARVKQETAAEAAGRIVTNALEVTPHLPLDCACSDPALVRGAYGDARRWQPSVLP